MDDPLALELGMSRNITQGSVSKKMIKIQNVKFILLKIYFCLRMYK